MTTCTNESTAAKQAWPTFTFDYGPLSGITVEGRTFSDFHVYQLIRNGKVMYVGESVNVFSRLGQHVSLRRPFDLVRMEGAPSRDASQAREAELIHELHPPWNRVCTGCQTHLPSPCDHPASGSGGGWLYPLCVACGRYRQDACTLASRDYWLERQRYDDACERNLVIFRAARALKVKVTLAACPECVACGWSKPAGSKPAGWSKHRIPVRDDGSAECPSHGCWQVPSESLEVCGESAA